MMITFTYMQMPAPLYRNTYASDTHSTDWAALLEADAAGIGQSPKRLSFTILTIKWISVDLTNNKSLE